MKPDKATSGIALRVLCGTGNQTHFDASTKSHEREYCANLKSQVSITHFGQ